jgi:hypothetical protein
MTLGAMAQWITDSPLGTVIRESEHLFAYIESAHMLAISIVVGSIAVIDLRLLGLAWIRRPISRVTRDVLPYTWSAFAGALATGLLLFTAHAVDYVVNPYFLVKMSLLLLAGINMLVFHLLTARGLADWDQAAHTPFSVKFAGAVSLLLWVGIVMNGRWIGFYLDQLRFGG